MAELNVEGTYYVDGLIEGPLFGPEDRDAVETFVRQAGAKGIRLHASFDRARFSILADGKPVQGKGKTEPVDKRVAQCMDDWLQNYSVEECMQLTSSLRSVEYVPGRELQTLYGIRPDRKANVEQRSVPADTIAPTEPLSRRQIFKVGGIALAVFLVGLGLSAIVVPYRKLGQRLVDRVKPFDMETLKVETPAFEGLFSLEAVQWDKRDQVLRFVFKKADGYPGTSESLDEAWKAATSLERKLALEALARNSLRCEMFDRKGKFMSQRQCYMYSNEEAKSLFAIVVPYNRYLGRIHIGY